MAEALLEEVSFGPGSIELSEEGNATLDEVARVLIQYPWMTIDVQAHSDASNGARCTELTNGRASNSKKHLKFKGVVNTMSTPRGKCGVKRAITVGNANGNMPAPDGCDGTSVAEQVKAKTGWGIPRTCKLALRLTSHEDLIDSKL